MAWENFYRVAEGLEFLYLLDTDWLIILYVSSETRPSAFGGLRPRDQHDRRGNRASFFAGSGCILVSGMPGVAAGISISRRVD